jgi:glycosyltransferase involved in cell wall biosynthesis
MSLKILFLVPYPFDEAPSQRFRFEQYFRVLAEKDIRFKEQSFLTHANWRLFYKSSHAGAKALALLNGFLRRIFVLPQALFFDYVFIHREAAPIGPPVFEFILAKILRKKIIYDFDDAIWMTDKIHEGRAEKLIRCRGKVKWICGWSYKVSCGNEYLRSYAARNNPKSFLVPTTIDTENGHTISLKKENTPDKIVIGWTGSHSTLKYLQLVEKELLQLEEKFAMVEFHVVADKKPALSLKRLHFKPWSQQTEVTDLAVFDIGIMPLPDDEWAKGKCGFKALQYMSMEVATVASPVGVNPLIIQHGVNGFLAKEGEWLGVLTQLIENKALRMELGREGRKTVENHFSVKAVKDAFVNLFS